MVAPGMKRYELQSSRPEEKPGAPPGSGYFRNIVGIIPFGTNRHSGGLENEPIGICHVTPQGPVFVEEEHTLHAKGQIKQGSPVLSSED